MEVIKKNLCDLKPYEKNPRNNAGAVAVVAVAPTLTSSGTNYRFVDGEKLSFADMIAIQTFPRDYDFGKESVQYVCGMSVPPVMMANLAAEIYEQWLK